MRYEYTVPMSFGAIGYSGQFAVSNPWGTPCEVCAYMVGLGSSGQVVISPDTYISATYNPLSVPNDGGLRGWSFIFVSGAQTLTPPAVFVPMPAPRLYATFAQQYNEPCVVIMVFRRAVETLPSPMPPTLMVNEEDEHDWHRQYQEDVLGGLLGRGQS